jgi:hypothetical protein
MMLVLEESVHRRTVSQDNIILALKSQIESVVTRPKIYFGKNVEELRGFLIGYVDALARACGGHGGGFLYGEIPQTDPTKSVDENVAALTSAAKRFVAEVPNEPNAD